MELLWFTIELRLRLISEGGLVRWLGPALRGLLNGRFKALACQFPSDVRDRDWVHCKGCPHLTTCPYGSVFEAEPAEGVRLAPGATEVPRPAWLAPSFPLPALAVVGAEIPVVLHLVGETAIAQRQGIVASLVDCGRTPGIGPDHIRFDVRFGRESRGVLRSDALPPTSDALAGILPRVGIGLTAPFVPRRVAASDVPTFAELFRSAFCTVRDLFAAHATAIPGEYRELMEAAQSVSMIDHCFEPFEQERWSNRSKDHYAIRGWVGGGIYADVPMSLLPWMIWGGRFHSGSYRAFGAGGWRIVLD